jgi:DNA integrity scanning protein DisA with diadenylate cyclase activity
LFEWLANTFILLVMTIDIVLAIAIGSLSIVMSAIGGIIATNKRPLRAAFVLMGVLSVILVIQQAIRAAKSQDDLEREVEKVNSKQNELNRSQSDLLKAQAELRNVNTGGEAFPVLYAEVHQDYSSIPKSADFSISSSSSQYPLYAISVKRKCVESSCKNQKRYRIRRDCLPEHCESAAGPHAALSLRRRP